MELAQSALDRQTPFASAHRTLVSDMLQPIDLSRLAASASHEVRDQLTRQVARIAGRALMKVFSPSEPNPASTTYYESFIAHLDTSAGRREIETAFPVLPALLERSARQWVAALEELLQRLSNDDATLANRIGGSWGLIGSLSGGLGDSHRHGRTVWRVTSTDGTSVAYKPRPLAPESLVYERLAAEGAPVPVVIDAGEYGWVDWLESTPVTDVERFWKSAGTVAAVCHLEGVGDLHYGNVIISNNAIVPIDLECVHQPGRDPEDPLAECLADSVLATGLFPGWFGQDGPVARDNSGLFGRRHYTDGRRYPVWDRLGTDGLHMVEILGTGISDGEPARLPDGSEVPLDREVLGASLENTLDRLSLQESVLDRSVEPRHLVRDTGIYARQISRLLDPENLADPSAFAATARDFPDLPTRFVDRIDEAGEAALIEAEAAALLRLDVPLHRSRGHDLVLDDDTVILDVFDRSGSERRERRITRLRHTPGSFHRELVSIHLDHGVGYERPQALAPTSTSSTRDAVRSLATQLLENAIGGSENPTWLELQFYAGGTQASGQVGQTSLYDGSAGIAIALAAAAHVCDDTELAATAVQLLEITNERSVEQAARLAATAEPADESSDSFLDRVSWPSKSGGLGAAQLAVGQILGRTELIDATVSRLSDILQTSVRDGERLDIVGGWSGLLSTGLAAFDASGDSQLKALLVERTSEVIAEAHRQTSDPVAGRRLASLGVAHRGSGLALVAARAASTLCHDDARSLAQELLEREDARIERRDGIGASMQRSGDASLPRPGWCGGIAGYLAVRTSPWVSELHETPMGHIQASIDALGGPLAENRSGLCCGDAGVLVALTHAVQVAGIDAAVVPCKEYESRLVSLAAGQSPISMVPGFAHHGSCLYMGLGGLAYALAYTCEPTKIPNLLFGA